MAFRTQPTPVPDASQPSFQPYPSCPDALHSRHSSQGQSLCSSANSPIAWAAFPNTPVDHSSSSLPSPDRFQHHLPYPRTTASLPVFPSAVRFLEGRDCPPPMPPRPQTTQGSWRGSSTHACGSEPNCSQAHVVSSGSRTVQENHQFQR